MDTVKSAVGVIGGGSTNECSVTLERAQEILADSTQPSELRAAANTIVSLRQAIVALEYEATMWKENAIEMGRSEERARRELDEYRGVVR